MKKLFETNSERSKPRIIPQLRGRRRFRSMSPALRVVAIVAIFAFVGGLTVAISSWKTSQNSAYAAETTPGYTGDGPNGSSTVTASFFGVTAVGAKPAVHGASVEPNQTIDYSVILPASANSENYYRLLVIVPAYTSVVSEGSNGWDCSMSWKDTTFAQWGHCWHDVRFASDGSARKDVKLTLSLLTYSTIQVGSVLQFGYGDMACTPDGDCRICQDPVVAPTTPPVVIPPTLSTKKTLAKVNAVAAVSGQTVQPGDVLTYSLTTTNSGGPMTDVGSLTDTVPVATTYRGQTSSAEGWAVCLVPTTSSLGSPAGTACTHSIPKLAANGSLVLTFTVVVDTVIPSSVRFIQNLAIGSGCTPTVTSCSPPPNPLPPIVIPPIVVPPALSTVKTLTTVNGVAAIAGQTVKPGDVLKYTLTTTNSAGPMTSPETLTDTVPVGTTYKGQTSPAEGWSNCVAPTGNGLGSAAGTSCLRDVVLAAAPAAVVLTFTVIVDKTVPASITEIKNLATGPGCAPTVTSCAPVPNPLPPLVPGFTVKKSVTTVAPGFAKPGQTATYKVVLTNTGETAYSGTVADAASFDDDMTAVLDDATYNNDATFVSSDGKKVGAFSYQQPHLKWSGALALSGTVTVTYSVTVAQRDPISRKYAVGSDQWLNNAVTTSREGGCIAVAATLTKPATLPANCTTSTPVQSFSTTKVANASTLTAGNTLTYTVTVVNDGQVAYTKVSPSSFIDNLALVLTNATYNNDADGGATYAAPVISWSGALAVGDSVVVTYSVTAKRVQTGNHRLVNDVITPEEGGCAAAALGALNMVGTRPDRCQIITKLTDLPLPVVSG